MLSAVNINDNKIIFSDYRLIKEDSFLLEDRRTRITPNDVLLTIVGAIGRTAVVSKATPKFTLQRSVAVISPLLIDSKFLMYQFESPRIALHFKKNARGTAQKGVYLKTLGNTEIWLPPLNEQHRIVAKIEELFSDLDKGIESLKTAQAQLKVYRQALLKHAFEGKLTAQWRADNPDKLETADALLKRIQKEREQRYQQQVAEWGAAGQKGRKPKALSPVPPLTVEESIELPKLPQGWRWIRPEEIASQEPYSIGIGPFGSNLKVSDYRDSGVPLVFVKNITRSNFSADLKFIDRDKYEELYAHAVQALDLLITKMGDPPGDCEIYPAGAPNAVLTADCLKYRLWDKFANRQMYKHCINSNLVKRQLGLITRGVAQKKISVERFKTIALPLMAVAEQQVLVEILDSKLSEADQLDKTLDTALRQAEALRQSILKKAFSGQLVPQDPADEPASALLARIKAERPQSSKKIHPARTGATR
ncbi:MAG TPA: restriction endonuclease subunit S [Accumulibacter sp.]|jgi:type I restriction enzyme S subunit|nr:restriction endonuclease subunit S [Accumulibacter sp.]